MDLPATFGPYALLDEIGHGATGGVFLARSLIPGSSLPCPLVLKRLHPELTGSADFVRRFKHEAAIATTVDSPCVAKVYDVGSVDGTLYIAMEYVPGEPLSAILERARQSGTPFPVGWAASVALDMLEGLAALHSATGPAGEVLAAIHRDVAPQNVILGVDSRTRLIDLGLGKSRWQDWKTGTGVVLGTPGYMAPEQCAGQPLDHRADLYAVGVILWELVTLEHHVRPGPATAMLIEALRVPFRPPSSVRPELGRALDAVLDRALARDPEKRFPSAEAFSRALRTAVPERPLTATFVRPPPADRISSLLSLDLPSPNAREIERRVVYARHQSLPATEEAPERFAPPDAPERWICPRCRTRYASRSGPCPEDGTELLHLGTGDPMFGRVLADRFLVLDLIGRGGMGVVYRAVQLSVERQVALKLLRVEARSSRDRVERFRSEAKMTAQLRSPHTVTLHDFGQLPDGALFMAMELVDGRSLGELIEKEGPLEPARVRGILEQICTSLEEAHAAGLIHRDLKPANVMVERRDGREIAKVLDFGIAKVARSDSGLTSPGLILGTPAYMSPEQFEPEGRLTPASDLYAFGVMTFQMLSGRLPFEGESLPKLLIQHVTAPPPRLEAFLRTTPDHARLQMIIDHCLPKRPEERFQSARDIRRLLASPSSPRVPEAASEPLGRSSRPLLFAAVLLAILLGAYLWRARRPTEESAPAPVAEARPERRDGVAADAPKPENSATVDAGTAAAPEPTALDAGTASPPEIAADAGTEEPALVESDRAPTPPPVPPESEPIQCVGSERGLCIIEARIGHARLRMLVDTFAKLTLLKENAARRAGVRYDLRAPEIVVKGDDVPPYRSLDRTSIAAGGYREDDVLVGVTRDLELDDADGILGLSYLSLYRSRVDGEALHLRPIDAGEPKRGGHGPSWWKHRFQRARQRVERAEQKLTEAERAVRAEEQRIGSSVDGLRATSNAKAELELMKSELDALAADAGRHAVPFDWRR